MPMPLRCQKLFSGGSRTSHDTVRRVVEEFYNAMPRLSYLFVAAAESLLKINNNFELMEIGGAFVYVKNRG